MTRTAARPGGVGGVEVDLCAPAGEFGAERNLLVAVALRRRRGEAEPRARMVHDPRLRSRRNEGRSKRQNRGENRSDDPKTRDHTASSASMVSIS